MTDEAGMEVLWPQSVDADSYQTHTHARVCACVCVCGLKESTNESK